MQELQAHSWQPWHTKDRQLDSAFTMKECSHQEEDQHWLNIEPTPVAQFLSWYCSPAPDPGVSVHSLKARKPWAHYWLFLE